jgi:hypothetical protein
MDDKNPQANNNPSDVKAPVAGNPAVPSASPSPAPTQPASVNSQPTNAVATPNANSNPAMAVKEPLLIKTRQLIPLSQLQPFLLSLWLK